MRTPKKILRDLLPGLLLPALIYFVVSRRAPTIVALAAASSVPALDSVARVLRRKAPSLIGLCFIGITAISVGLAVWFRSPMFILVKGAVVSALVGIAFAVSAVVRRPLTRTIAVRLSTDHPEARRGLAERWGHPHALKVFCALSAGWGIWLILSAAQQAGLALTLSPGTVIALEAPLQGGGTALGILASVLYVRRHHRAYPELRLLPQLAA
jgi:intracellular septation protein A